jgi:hypothetical protein
MRIRTRAGFGSLAEYSLKAGVLGEEEACVDQYADLLVGRLEQLPPLVHRHVGAVRVDADDLALRDGRGPGIDARSGGLTDTELADRRA